MLKRMIFLLLVPIALHSYTELKEQNSIKPAVQNESTEKLILDNGIQVYLISDPRAEKSAAAMSVNTGSWQDPKEFPGLAHFLEHMLFLGTKKYPKESEFQAFVQDHAGDSNAFTQGLYTTFLFDIDTAAYGEALDRFSSFFKEPLFNASGVKREMHAVNSEHEGNINNDVNRRYRVWQVLGNPKHPGNAFSTGNLETLKGVTTKHLRKWYEEHYSSNLMTLVLYSPLTLEKLQELAVATFTDIPDRHLKPFETDQPLMLSQMAEHIAYIPPKNENRTLTLCWELPKELTTEHIAKPDEIVCYLLGHEGEESLLAQLKREGLAESLACGAQNWRNNNMMFYLQINLTNKGVKKFDQVITRCFQAIASLKEKGVPEYLYEDIKKIETLKLLFPTRENPFNEVRKHIEYLQYIPLQDYPTYTTLPGIYTPELYQQVLSYLTPDRCYIDLIAPLESEAEDHEKWYGIDYYVRKVPAKTLKEWQSAQSHPAISVPAKNNWIPEETAVLAQTRADLFPEVITLENSAEGILYYAQDHLFLSPKVIYKIRYKSPLLLSNNPKNVVMAELLIEHLKEMLNKQAYIATMAGYEWAIERQDDSLYFSISGYSDKAPQFLQLVLEHLKRHEISQENFANYKDLLLRKYQNFTSKSPLQVAIEMFRKVIYNRYVPEYEKGSALGAVHFMDFKTFSDNVFRKLYTEMVVYGNVTESETLQMWHNMHSTLNSTPYPKEDQPHLLVACLPTNKGPFYLEKLVKAKGNAVVVGIEQPAFTYERYAAQEVLSQSIGKEFFEELRTRQQTAYLIGQFSEEVHDKLLNVFALESHSHDSRDLLSRIELLIEHYLRHLSQSSLPEESFNTIKSSLIEVLKAPPDNIGEMGKELATMAFKYDGDFKRKQEQLKAMEELTYERFVEIIDEILGKKNKQRLAILIKGNLSENVDIQYTKAKNISWLKERSHY